MNYRNLSYSVTPSNTIHSPKLDDAAQRLKTRLTFSSVRPSAPKRPLINHNFGNGSSPQNGYYQSRIGAYHMSRQSPDVLDQLYIPSPDNQGQSVGIGRESTYTSLVNYRGIDSGGETSYMSGRLNGHHSPALTPVPRLGTPSGGNSQLSYLHQVLSMRRAQSCSPSSLVQLATRRGGGRTSRLLRNRVGSGVATVRLAGVKDTAQGQQEMMECSDQIAPNPCDKEVVLSALRQKRKRWTSSALEENGLQSPITSPSAKRSRKERPAPPKAPQASITTATADRKRSNTSNTVPAVKRSKGFTRSGPSNVLSLSEPECEEEESDNESNERSRTSRSGTPSIIANGCNSRSHTPPILLDEAEIDRKRDESLGTLKAVFPSPLEAEKKDSLRRKLPIFCATGSKPHLPSPLSSTHSVTQEDLNRDRQATVARLKAFLEADDETDGNMSGNPANPASAGGGVVSIAGSASTALVAPHPSFNASSSLQNTPSVIATVSKSSATKTVSFAPIPTVAKQVPSLANVVTAVASVTSLTNTSPLVTTVTSVTSSSTNLTASGPAVSSQAPLQLPKPSAGGIMLPSLSIQTPLTTAGGITAATVTSKPSLSSNAQPHTEGLWLADPPPGQTHPLATALTQPVGSTGGSVQQISIPTCTAAQNATSLAKGQFTFQLNPQPASATPTLSGKSLSNGSGVAQTQLPSFSLTSQPSTKLVSQRSVQFSSTLQSAQLSTSNQAAVPAAQPSLFNAKQPSTTQPSLFNVNSQPSTQPSLFNAKQPSTQPSLFNAKQPSTQPSLFNAKQPSTTQPSLLPSSQPSIFNVNPQPSQPSLFNTKQPSTTQPSLLPSSQPSLFSVNPQPSQPSLFNAKQPNTTQLPLFNANIQPSSQPSLFNAKQPSTTQPSRLLPSSQPSLFDTNPQSSIFTKAQPLSTSTPQPSIFNFTANGTGSVQGTGQAQGPQQFKFGAGSSGGTGSALFGSISTPQPPQPSVTSKPSQPGPNIFNPGQSVGFTMNLASGQTNPLTNNVGGGAVLGGQKHTPFQFGVTAPAPSNAGQQQKVFAFGQQQQSTGNIFGGGSSLFQSSAAASPGTATPPTRRAARGRRKGKK